MRDRTYPSILRLSQIGLKAIVGSDFLLQDISLNIEPGTKTGIIGASGAGKTSLLRLLNRLASPTIGEIYLEDRLIETFAPNQLRRRIVLVPQEPKLLGMTVSDALSYPLMLQKQSESEIRSKIDTWTELLRIPNLWLDKNELQLSVGQRQLVTIARALIMQPQILLLDEPTSALDIGTATHVLGVLDRLNQSQGLTIIMVNHQLELIRDFGDRFILLNTGRVELDTQAEAIDWQVLQQKLLRSQAEQQEEWE